MYPRSTNGENGEREERKERGSKSVGDESHDVALDEAPVDGENTLIEISQC